MIHNHSSIDMLELANESIATVITSPPYPGIAKWDKLFESQSCGPNAGRDPRAVSAGGWQRGGSAGVAAVPSRARAHHSLSGATALAGGTNTPASGGHHLRRCDDPRRRRGRLDPRRLATRRLGPASGGAASRRGISQWKRARPTGTRRAASKC